LKPGAFVTSTDLALPWLPEGMGAFQHIVIEVLEQEAKISGPMVRARVGCWAWCAGREGVQKLTAFVFRGLAVGMGKQRYQRRVFTLALERCYALPPFYGEYG
jgi:hypothetical protein